MATNRIGGGHGVLLIVLGLVACSSDGAGNDVEPGGETQLLWQDTAGLFAEGFGTVRFMANDGNTLDALTYRASLFDPATGPVWFVMHGASRDAERYIDSAAPAAERHAALAIVIRFPKSLYPSSSSYTLGVTSSGKADGVALREGRWAKPEQYRYAEVENVFDGVRTTLGGRQTGYFLFGHSAGAQFTHRLLTFLEAPRVLAAVAANAGWYTLPRNDDRPETTLPYGLAGTPVDPRKLERYFGMPFAVLLGERDTTTPATDRLVRGTPEAMAQGEHRLARGRYYHAAAAEIAAETNADFAWRLAIVPRARHSAAQMVDSAAGVLFTPERSRCESTPAAEASDLIMTEVLADPPQGMAGDANGDGIRDPSDDEFVEFVNTGDRSICLAGYSLGDAEDPERHVFPLGTELAGGTALVVFGGGVPLAGEFGGSATLTALFGGRLNLNNTGDVVTLRDASDIVVTAVSWGNCGAASCATEHIAEDLGIEASIARNDGGEWVEHGELDRQRFSPGRKSSGERW